MYRSPWLGVNEQETDADAEADPPALESSLPEMIEVFMFDLK